MGNLLNSNETKKYDELSTPDLAQITESLCVRLNLFEGNYPAFFPHLIRAVQEHPNTTKSDYAKLDSFCKLFDLDWRGDRDVKNKKEFLASNPIYLTENDRSNFQGYGHIGNSEVTAMLRKACTPFVADLANEVAKRA